MSVPLGRRSWGKYVPLRGGGEIAVDHNPTPCRTADPGARGLGDADRGALDDGLVHLTRSADPGVQELQRAGRPVGRTEEYDVQRGIWTALIDSSIVSDAAGGEPLRCPGADAALALLRLALGEHLARW
ncbi:hypothetical protein [Streptomyces sp. BE303]|uniref:hypothetical protein n=1 Tax=Streptomyces sp. BE303 TaxID=3002528 RepID=UPI002E793C38|nr:hypothetical protein [Streptomyces sp. BE303]MED7949669.1 hypothetical protein [Streptomyces sp. BE303]